VKRSRRARTIRPGHEPRLAPGVRGYTVWSHGELYVPLVIADHEGRGDVARYLDTLPTDRVVKFPTVVSVRLIDMLLRRGFAWATEMTPHGPCELLVRCP